MSLSETAEAILDACAAGNVSERHDLLANSFVPMLGSQVGKKWTVSCSGAGLGPQADVAWARISRPDDRDTAQAGIYLVYLFARDGSALYLSLNQGTGKLKGGLPPLQKRALDIRTAVGNVDGYETSIRLASNATWPKKYQAANALALKYSRSHGVDRDEILTEDLSAMLGLLERALDAGIAFDPEIEPQSLVFKWSATKRADTVAVHQRIAEEKGSVWWGKMGSSGMSAPKLQQLQEQLDAGFPAHVYLKGSDGTFMQTRLEAITANPGVVDDERFPSYYSKSDCRLFVRIADFKALDTEWPLNHLVLANKPDPDAMAGALGNQTPSLFVFERQLPGDLSRPKPKPPATRTSTNQSMSLTQLVNETLWPKSRLTEVLDSLDLPQGGKGQVVLAGPPGTGKTWVARCLAKHLTGGDEARQGLVQFHPSYGYEEFIAGIRPAVRDGYLEFRRSKGVVLRMCDAVTPGKPSVLIVDELNRANIPRVFGELLYLLEYRGETALLQYEDPDQDGAERFELPEEFRLIATMNTADRSTRSVDVALRRRFDLFECPPDSEILDRYYQPSGLGETDVVGLANGLNDLNAELASLLDRHHAIGHTFFMKRRFSRQDLSHVWTRQVWPLIEDFFFDQPDIADEFQLRRFWPDN